MENACWQYFCGFATIQQEVPLHSPSLTKWRQRVGADRLVTLFEKTVTLAVSDKHVTRRELAQVIVDTTVQEKNIIHPTDSRLSLKALEKLADAAKHRGVQMRQMYRRVEKKASIMVSRYGHAKQ